jgi:hypothetical protein
VRAEIGRTAVIRPAWIENNRESGNTIDEKGGELMDWWKAVCERFPKRAESDQSRDWEQVKARLAVGDEVSGEVIARAPFGAWLDIGVGFPALLEIVEIDGLTPEASRAGDWCPVGSRISAWVTRFRDDNRQVYLSQRRVPLVRAPSKHSG